MPLDTNYEVKISGFFQGDVWLNVMHFQMTGGAGGGRTVDVGRLQTGIAAALIPLYAAACCPDVEISSVRVQEVGIADPIIEKRAVTTPGEAVGDPLPASDAVLFTKRCNTGGRRNVGKLYLVGVPDSLAQGGIVDTEAAALVAFALALKTPIVSVGNTYSPVIWHRGPATAEFVTICNTRAQISRQNRRTLPVL